MATKSLSCEKIIGLPANLTFELLIKPSHIKNWWAAANVICIPKKNGILAISWGNDPDSPEYVTSFNIDAIEPPKRLLLSETRHFDSHNDKLVRDTKAEFIVEPVDDGNRSTLKIHQDGFKTDTKEQQEMYDACVKGWKDVFDEIDRYASTLK